MNTVIYMRNTGTNVTYRDIYSDQQYSRYLYQGATCMKCMRKQSFVVLLVPWYLIP